jgi:hypothetical protein
LARRAEAKLTWLEKKGLQDEEDDSGFGATRVCGRVARFFFVHYTKTGKKYQLNIKYTKWS